MTDRDVWVKGVVIDKDPTDNTVCVKIERWTGTPTFEWVQSDQVRPRTDGAEPEPVGDVARLREACHEAVTWLGIEVYPTKHSQRAAAILRQVLSEIPDGPVETCLLERLRGVCAWALDVLECPQLYTDQGRTDLQAALRAALAATPVGTPISRAEALSISQETIKRAEAERAEPTPEPPIEGRVQEGDVVDAGYGTVTGVCGAPFYTYRAWVHFAWGDELIPTEHLTIVSRPAPKHACGECRWFNPDMHKSCRYSLYGRAAGTPACEHFELWEQEPRP